MQPATPPLEVTPEELEGLLEGVREVLGEAGYQKLKAAIRTLSCVTELLETREATLASLRRLLCRARSEKTEAVLEQAGILRRPTPREPPTPDSEGTADGGRVEETGARAPWREGVSWRSAHRGAARHVAPRGSLPRVSARQSLSAAGAGAAGTDARPSSDCRYRVPTPEAALQSVRRSVHGGGSRWRGRGEVRRDHGQHDRAAPLWQRVPLESLG